MRTRRILIVGGLAAALLFAVSIGFLTISSASDRQAVSQQAANRVAFEALRNCIRSNFISAVVKRPAGRAPDATKDNLFPIIDCKQSIVTGKLVAISKVESDKYIALVLQGRAPIINNGRVVGSRASLLENVNSLQQAGHP